MLLQNRSINLGNKDIFDKISSNLVYNCNIDVCLLILIQDYYASILDSYSTPKFKSMGADPIESSDQKQIINLMREKKRLIIARDDDMLFDNIEYEHLITGISQEMYIPIFSQTNGDKIIGCFYLGCRKMNNAFDALLQNEYFNSDLSVISYVLNCIYNNCLIKKDFFSYMNMACEFYKNHSCRINHPFNVAYWCILIAKQIKLDEKYYFELYIAAILHDIGMLLVPQNIVNKSGKLSDNEFSILKQHTVFGFNMIKNLKDHIGLNDLDDIIRHHHERFDGTGYPDGLKAEDIPLLSRIIAVADATDAMFSDRVFQSSLPQEKVIEELSKNKGKQFDPYLAGIMINILIGHDEDIKSIIGPITWVSLIITTKSNCYNYQGNMINNDIGYEFYCDEVDFKDFIGEKSNEIIDCSLIVEKNNRFYEYNVLLGKVDTGCIFIKDIQYKPSNQYYSMYWNLTGEVQDNNLHISDAAIKKIGGNLITFCCIEQTPLNMKQIYTLKVLFENGEAIYVPGKNIRKYQSGNDTFYDFEFNNLNETIRDRIFKQLFNRQTEIRQFMLKASYYSVANNPK